MKIQFTNKQKNAAAHHGVKIPYAPAKRKAAQWRWYLILLIVSSPLLYFLLRMILSLVIVTAQGYVALDKVAVNCTEAGIVDAVFVEAGQDVKQGTVIARLEAPDLEAQKRYVELELSALKPDPPVNSTAREQLLQSRLDQTRRELDAGKKYYRTMTFLFQQGAATKAEVDQATERKDRARADYDNAVYEQQAYNEEKAGQTADGMPAYDKERTRLTARLDELEEHLARLPQTTPHSGRVLEVFASRGESLAPGTPIAVLGRSDKPYVVAYLDPKYAKYARHGRTARVELPDGRKIMATVSEDAQLTQRLPAHLNSPIGSRNLMLLIKLAFLSPPPPIHWVDGLPVEVNFTF